jgi:hypothetical protein
MRTIDLRRKLFIYYVSTQVSAFVPQGHQNHKLIYIKKKIRPSSSNIIHFYSQFNLFCTIPQRYHIATLERVRARVVQ